MPSRQREQHNATDAAVNASGRPDRAAMPDDERDALGDDATADWLAELDDWLGPFLAALGAAYVKGLASPGERKSMTPLATEVAGHTGHTHPTPQYHHLQQCITYSDWDTAPVLQLLAKRADAMLGGPDAVLIIDDTQLS